MEKPKLRTDEYKQVLNCKESALYVRNKVFTEGSCAIPLSLGNMTLFNISFVDLDGAIPDEVLYEDGSNGGCQININRKGSYALPWGTRVGEWGYLDEKWRVGEADATLLLPFFNTVLSGKNCFKKI